MNTININSYDHAFETLRHPDLAQALYDAGEVIMKDVLLTLHGKDHRERRVLEMRMFTRNYFHYYESEIFPRTKGLFSAGDKLWAWIFRRYPAKTRLRECFGHRFRSREGSIRDGDGPIDGIREA